MKEKLVTNLLEIIVSFGIIANLPFDCDTFPKWKRDLK